MLRYAGATLAASCLVAGCAPGAPERPPRGGPPAGGMLQESKVARPVALLLTGMDANNDFSVTLDELDAAIDAEFARADLDGSGVVTGFEMMDWGKTVLGDGEALPDLRAMDTDINYAVTLREFAVGLRHEFLRLDKDGDKRLTRAELLVETPTRVHGGGVAPESGQQRPNGSGRGGGRGGGDRPF